MKDLDRHYRDIGTCLLVINREDGLVLDAFGSLPVPVEEGCEGRDWRDVLGVPADGSGVVSQALSADVATPLPPMIIGMGADRDCVVGGMLVPQDWQGRPAALMFLRELALPVGPDLEAEIREQDIVAVLGVHLLEFSPSWGAAETEQLMMDLRSGLQQILREADLLGLPEGATITVVLREIEPEAALDITRALLSHLHQRLGGRGGGAQYARACAGLSQRQEGQSALMALVAANTALLQAQAGGEERIRFSSPWDPQALAARSLNASGAFRDRVVDETARAFLQTLVALPFRRDPDYAEAVLRFTVQQPGLKAAALLRSRGAASMDCLAAAVVSSGQVRCTGAGRVPRTVQGPLRRIEKQGESFLQGLVGEGFALYPLADQRGEWGYLLLVDEHADTPGFRPGSAALQLVGPRLSASLEVGGADGAAQLPAREMEKGIEGYVLDNMEGAIDQAVFLAGVDIPVAIIGEQGTGKMYVAQIVHNEGGGTADGLLKLDCRSYRNRAEAWSRITDALRGEDGRTLVFKSPQLLHTEIQARLARVLASRTLTDESGESRYISRNRFIALLPMEPAQLVQRGEFDARLAGVFAGYPIQVPPLRERRRAVLRWAHKILEQESAVTDRRMLGFTPDAERALREHDWPGNISEMRQLIRNALTRTDKEWLTPVDLGLYLGISPDGRAAANQERPFLELLQEKQQEEPQYVPSSQDELRLALGEALAASLETGVIRPLGEWLDDEIIEATCTRFGDDARSASEFLHTRARNIGRWLPRVRERQVEREGSLLWQDTRQLVKQWILECPPSPHPPQQLAADILLSLVLQECEGLSVAERARIMGVSTPTYQKRLKNYLENN